MLFAKGIPLPRHLNGEYLLRAAGRARRPDREHMQSLRRRVPYWFVVVLLFGFAAFQIILNPFGFSDLTQPNAAGLEISLSGLGQGQRPRRPMQQPCPERFLELTHAAADRSRRQLQPAGGVGKAPLLDDRDENCDILKMSHYIS